MLDDLRRERVKKLEALRKAGLDPYPAAVRRTHTIAEVIKSFAALSKKRTAVTVVGRLMGLRNQGGLSFADLRDESGSIQLVIKKDEVENFALLAQTLDIGDFVEARGPAFKTKRGERSVAVKDIRIIAKSLLPIPSEHFGIHDIETRLRKRYLELILDPAVKELFERKARFWEAARTFLKGEGFLEVETPVLEQIPGGAEAEPFKTHHNALDTDFYLRISLELPLKRLIVGGYEKVFEIGRIFRNEGIDAEHLQDYTQCECYLAYADYRAMMKLVERMFKGMIKAARGTLTSNWQGKTIEWGKKWPTVDYYEAFKKHVGVDLGVATATQLRERADKAGLTPEAGMGRGRLVDLLFKKFVRPTLIQPAFLIDPPVEIEPLAKRSPKDPGRVERFQVVACGSELGKGFSELNDPLDQRARFEEQMKLRAAGDKEAQQLDEEYLEAMEYGMPPTAGFGVSERLFAVLMDKPVRETVFFPPMRRSNRE